MTSPEIFLSYSWKNKNIANKIFYDLSFVGFKITKDDQSLKYTDRISDFMAKIRTADYTIVLLSDTYLKSLNCMIEILHLTHDDSIWKKLLPVKCDDININDTLERLEYTKYWQDKALILENSIKSLTSPISTTMINELNVHKEILNGIDSFLYGLKDRMYISHTELFEKFYNPLTNKIGANPNFSKMIQLLKIWNIKKPILRLSKINTFCLQNNIENTYCYSVKATSYVDLKKYELAITNYKKAVELDEFNMPAWNNLGQIYEKYILNFDRAKESYEMAILSKPDFDIPRLNLAVLLKNHFKDTNEAKKQNEEILKFDENNPKAHNNLANIYKLTEYFDLDKAEKHYKIAVNQNNLEAIIGYANFLKAFRHRTELGNYFYGVAKKLDTQNEYKDVIEVMLKSEKG